MRGTAFNLLISCSFLGYLCTPLFLQSLGIGTPSSTRFEQLENRAQTSFPGLPTSVRNWKDLPEDIEAWFNDHQGLRPLLFDLSARLHHALRISPHPGKVVYGKQGWLFLSNDYERTFDQHTGRYTVPQSHLDHWLDTLLQRQDWLAAKGIPLLVVMPPDKPSIYPEYLPAWVQHTTAPTAADRLVGKTVGSGLNFLDLRPVLKASRQEFDDLLYSMTDTHWTRIGAYVGYRATMDRICELFDLPRHMVRMQGYSSRLGGGGDLALFLGMHTRIREKHYTLELNPTISGIHFTDFAGAPLNLPEDHRIRNHDDIVAINAQPLLPLTVLFLHDSFGRDLSPLFNRTFHRVVHTHISREPGLQMTVLVNTFNPDLVIFEFAERVLNGPAPKHRAWWNPGSADE